MTRLVTISFEPNKNEFMEKKDKFSPDTGVNPNITHIAKLVQFLAGSCIFPSVVGRGVNPFTLLSGTDEL